MKCAFLQVDDVEIERSFAVGVIGLTLCHDEIPIGVLAGRAMVDKINREKFEKVTVVLLTAGAILLLVF